MFIVMFLFRLILNKHVSTLYLILIYKIVLNLKIYKHENTKKNLQSNC